MATVIAIKIAECSDGKEKPVSLKRGFIDKSMKGLFILKIFFKITAKNQDEILDKNIKEKLYIFLRLINMAHTNNKKTVI